ncbi:MAG: transposase [Acidobacteria bacterium]|nr:transposase [Acidobacteriota bacterium]MCL5287762.1 transposase [Acidobacteriota bacterium]
MEQYARHLPHWQPPGQAIFLTWRLHGSLPANVIRELKSSKFSDPGRQFHHADCYLDTASNGPLWLKDPRVAQLVVHALQFGSKEQNKYQLHAYVVMANHVHMLLSPLTPLRRITQSLKGFTAREANALLRRTGRRFWQDESFDHWVRDLEEFARIVTYIENNPVKAGLVAKPELWPWSSAACAAS